MKFAFLFTAMLVTGCSKKDEPAPPATKSTPPASTDPSGSAAAPTPPAPVEPAAPAAPAAGTPTFTKLTCDGVYPTALREKYLVAERVEDKTDPTKESANCVFNAKGEQVVITARCYEGIAEAEFAKVSQNALAPGMTGKVTSLDGVGKGANRADLPGGNIRVVAIDDDASCVLSGVVPKRIDPAAFAKDVLAAWPPK